MEEQKAVAYYDDLTRKGEGAARFKRGLGFSSNDDQNSALRQRGSALVSSSSSFLSSFVRASSPTTASKLEKESQLQSIQNKLKKKSEKGTMSREQEIDRDKDRHSRRRSRSRSRSRSRERRKRRSRGRSPCRGRRRSRSRSACRDRRYRSSSRSLSPREARSDRDGERREKSKKEKNGAVDYLQLIEGYDKMSQSQRVKAKMKFQLAETAEKDPIKGPGWERFEFDKDAPLDDEEIEVAEDDDAVIKHIGQSFRFSTIEARRNEQIKAAHDEAIFGASTAPSCTTSDREWEVDNLKKGSNDNGLVTNLLSEKVLAKQPGSWRDRVRKA